MKKWTIAFVNYKTTVYMKWQLKILYEFNNPEDFEIIIVDNSKPFQKQELEELTKFYNEKWNNIKIIYNETKEKIGSRQHGEGLTIALKTANSEYFLAQDPDFFFVIKNHLKFLQKFLDEGKVAVGAPYTRGVGLGHPKFPALWGAAHPLKLIQHLDCQADTSEWARNQCKIRFSDKLDFSYDVGYKIREALSSENDSTNFIAFENREINDLAAKIGEHSYEVGTQAYLYDGKKVAYHLFRGSFTDRHIDNCDCNKDLSQKTLIVRDKLSKYFYDYIRLGRPPFIFPKVSYFKKLIYNKIKYSNKRTLVFFNTIKVSYKKKS